MDSVIEVIKSSFRYESSSLGVYPRCLAQKPMQNLCKTGYRRCGRGYREMHRAGRCEDEVIMSAEAIHTLPVCSPQEPVDWLHDARARLHTEAVRAAETLCARYVATHGADEASVDLLGTAQDLLAAMIGGGKLLRPLFAYVGWCSTAAECTEAARAAAALELLHAAALLQDDVMDRSVERRGAAAAHVVFASRHQRHGLPGDALHYGESAATLLSDLCLMWSGQALQESGMSADALARAWPYFDLLRSELVVGQFLDISSDIRRMSFASRLEVARSKSGNYTVRRPLELGAALAGSDDATRAALATYGDHVGEAFQLRDDLVDLTGRGDDIRSGRGNAVTALAADQLSATDRAELTWQLGAGEVDDESVRKCQELLCAAGVPDRAERIIEQRLATALAVLGDSDVDRFTVAVLTALAESVLLPGR
jgi:geranylgeranyl diphosphate synthase type I